MGACRLIGGGAKLPGEHNLISQVAPHQSPSPSTSPSPSPLRPNQKDFYRRGNLTLNHHHTLLEILALPSLTASAFYAVLDKEGKTKSK